MVLTDHGNLYVFLDFVVIEQTDTIIVLASICRLKFEQQQDYTLAGE